MMKLFICTFLSFSPHKNDILKMKCALASCYMFLNLHAALLYATGFDSTKQ